MNTSLLLTAAVAAGAVFLWFHLRGRSQTSELTALQRDLHTLIERVRADGSHLSQRLEGIDSRLMETTTSNSEVFQNVYEGLGQVREATTAVAEQARQFTALQDLLRAPKARGGVGEAMLEELLGQILPSSGFDTQYRFASGVIVDAIVRAGDRLICIDSKFPLANYQRMSLATTDAERGEAERAFAADVSKHIKDISTRYICPDEGTLDFAVMYVPAEGLYGEVLRLQHAKVPLFETAMSSRVILMSPQTMYAYLQTVVFGLRCLQIEKNAEAILGFCGRLEQDVQRFAAEYEVLGSHLTNANKKFGEGARKLERFRSSLERVTEMSDEHASSPGGAPEAAAGLDEVQPLHLATFVR
jgi:DNA recombination protein RmuC